ncbi:MAG TPA: hypothetical protein VGZ52_00035 [Acidimicrobiales bacterium]|nr:hypothetical protein [Acidimicrobiales bacterium]
MLFEDDFNGPAGSGVDPSKWVLHDENCAEVATWSCIRSSNVFQDGNGDLVLRTQREPGNYLGGGPFSGAWIDTFNYGWGWPASTVKAAWAVPYHIEMRAKMPSTPGAWPAAWNINVDRPTSLDIFELDWAEEQMSSPAYAGCHQHRWLNGGDTQAWDGGVSVSNMGTNFHLFSADVYADRTEYRVDGMLCGIGPATSGRHGLLLDNVIAPPGSWASGGQQPAASDSGPWDFVIDYVRVTAG